MTDSMILYIWQRDFCITCQNIAEQHRYLMKNH